jgi:hypothetical protein
VKKQHKKKEKIKKLIFNVLNTLLQFKKTVGLVFVLLLKKITGQSKVAIEKNMIIYIIKKSF